MKKLIQFLKMAKDDFVWWIDRSYSFIKTWLGFYEGIIRLKVDE